jgi:pimeloyl-ACP methyl ester carboxylesterase
MLFIHGFPEFWYEWRRQLAEFGGDHHAVAPDMRGFNLSSKPAAVKEYRAPYCVEDIRQLIQVLGHTSCVLVAHDWGGAIAWAFAMAHPQMVEKLVIVNSPHPAIFARELKHNPAQAEASQYMLLLRSEAGEEKMGENNFERLWRFSFKDLHAQGVISDEERDAYFAAWGQPGALTGGLNWYRASPLRPPGPDGTYDGMPPPDLDPADFRVTMPTLVIWGMQDTALLPGNLDGLKDVVADLTVERVPDGSHWVIHEQPDLVNGLIRRFIGE